MSYFLKTTLILFSVASLLSCKARKKDELKGTQAETKQLFVTQNQCPAYFNAAQDCQLAATRYALCEMVNDYEPKDNRAPFINNIQTTFLGSFNWGADPFGFTNFPQFGDANFNPYFSGYNNNSPYLTYLDQNCGALRQRPTQLDTYEFVAFGAFGTRTRRLSMLKTPYGCFPYLAQRPADLNYATYIPLQKCVGF